jgi:hypothetical protein
MNPDKVRENRIRRMAQRQGLCVVKSRRRDPQAIDFGYYYIVDISTNCVVAGTERTQRAEYTLNDVEEYLTGTPAKRPLKHKKGR